MKTLSHWFAAWACLGMLIGPANQTGAADPPARTAAADKPDLTYVPSEAVAAVVIHPQVLLTRPDADWLPLEVLTAWGI
ncbi:MAG TPA: hypothetical protein VKB78_01720, partial [Pirellulales bacterium]|nr:hypothetical protein [Pirellulales bacterium]